MPRNGTKAPRRPRRPQLPPQITSDVEDAYLGIDIGSHRTRACIQAGGREFIIENRHSHNIDANCYPGDFPSNIFVFDNGDTYLVSREDPDRLSVSAKYAFYVLANASDNLLQQYPSVHHLTVKKDDQMFREKLREGISALLSVVRDKVLAVCQNNKLRICKIGLTIPVQWTLEFEDVYRSIVSEVFTIDATAIYFYTETEALARYLYKHHASSLDRNNQYNTLMFFDFGGHNMNGCVFTVARDSTSPEGNSFFRVGKTFGAGGGSEQWEHHIGEWFSDLWIGMNGPPVPSTYRQELLDRFRRQKGREASSRENITTSFTGTVDGAPWRATLTLDDIEKAWEKALNRPLDTADHELHRLVRMEEYGRLSKPLVVVSGGTARNPATRSRMEALCDKYDVPVIFTDDFDVPIAYDSVKVAKAAAFVVSETLTVEQFFARGAAIGIQMKQSPLQGHPNAPVDWDDSGALLLDMHGQHEVELPVRWRDEFRLLCDPFFARLPRSKQMRVSAKDRSYDLIYLGKRKQGTWRFLLSREGFGDNMTLVLRQFHRKRKERPEKVKLTLRLPLYFDGNSGCIHIGAPSKALSELGLGLPLQPNETGDGEITPMEDSEPESDSDEEDQVLDASLNTSLSTEADADEVGDFEMFTEPSRGASNLLAAQCAQSTRRRKGVKPQRPTFRIDPYEKARRTRREEHGRLG